MKKIFSLFAAVLFVGSIFAGEEKVYTLTPAAGSNNSYTGNCDIVISGITWNLTGNSQLIPWRIGGKSLSKTDRALYSKTAIEDNISKIVIEHGAASSITVNSMKVIVASDAAFSNVISTLTPTFAASSKVTVERPDGKEWSNAYYKFVYSVTVSGDKNKFLEFVGAEFYSDAETGACGKPQLSVEAGNFKEAFDLELSCSTEGANIYYTLDGNDPTSASTLYKGAINISATTTVKAIAIKEGLENSEIVSATYTKVEPVTSNDIDFETADLDLYVNWDFSNIAIASTAITAHGGTYYGNTDGKASASITSKAAIALPGDLKFYTSKESGNTTESSWEVEVSADKEEWTPVANFSAITGSKGEWTERNVDLSAYKNVYVRISYSGSTAIRAIDDITLANAVPAAVSTPVFSVPTGEYAEAQSVELSCETEDAKIYYTLDGNDPTAESTEYTAAIVLNERGAYTIKAIAIKGEDKSKVASATYNINLPYTLAELATAELDDPSTVNIVLKNEIIKDFYIYNEKVSGVVFDIQKGDADIKIFFNNQTTIADWSIGGTLSGTLLNATWTTYKGEWQIKPGTGFKWANLEYKAPSATAIDNTAVEAKAFKTFENGQLVIIKNGVKYDITGAVIR